MITCPLLAATLDIMMAAAGITSRSNYAVGGEWGRGGASKQGGGNKSVDVAE